MNRRTTLALSTMALLCLGVIRSNLLRVGVDIGV